VTFSLEDNFLSWFVNTHRDATVYMPLPFCIRVLPSVNLWVRPVSQKPMKGISPSFGSKCIWVHICGWLGFGVKRSKVKVTAGNDPKTGWSPYQTGLSLSLQELTRRWDTQTWRDVSFSLFTYLPL